MRILFIGDVVGRSGRTAVCRELPRLKKRFEIDFAIVNGENSAGGFGITEAICQDLLDAGADVITTGNHVWDQRETLVYIDRHPQLLRPANFPAGTPGRGSGIYESARGGRVMVINIMGRVFMDPLDCPFQALERELSEGGLKSKADAIIVDLHAEATAEKQTIGHFADGRVTAVLGTHTHVPTADEHILPGGTAYMTDVGMCGDFQGVIGMRKEEPLQRMQSKIPNARFEPSLGTATICGVMIDVDIQSGLATRIEPLRMGGALREVAPD
ncbi:MAG: TIGR00282 family metallophosphoesterase [Rhodomicrobiaceae bacterium]